ncbi:hypothetical protein [Saccharothrix texasensis]|uniref:Uncharacterized protein n=1 Tax=Saccharothrix texasensis TaxID=103734 RepID=A0A3N1HGQ9_9PSEU|nr:hypothetical protein [Saccharothrix texasensis]ROP41676.1 hypothetical protein EDD40_7112 [Saccharothrix texasensis]
MSALRASRRNYPEIGRRQFDIDGAHAIVREPAGMGFVAGRGGQAHRFANKNRLRNESHPRPGIGRPMVGARWPANGSREKFPPPVARRHTGSGTWFVGESDAERVADLIDQCPERRDEAPRTATPTGAPGAAAPFSGDVRAAPPVADGAVLVFETWRRRIAEQVIHQEGVSL